MVSVKLYRQLFISLFKISIFYPLRFFKEFKTGNTHRYYPLQGEEKLNFYVRAGKNAILALTSKLCDSNSVIEIFIGEENNKKSTIRKNNEVKTEAATPDVLESTEYRGFWIKFKNNNVTVGRRGELTHFISWQDPDTFTVNYVGFRTLDSSGSWKIESK